MTGAEQLLQQGEERGQVKLILHQLELRFGAVSDDVAQRVRSASADKLDRYAERLLTVESLEDVLA